jgi:uncharacterized protein (DUF111 family)
MGAQLVHHPVSVSIRVAASEADEMDGLASESIHNLASYVMSAFHEVGDNDAIPDSFSSVRAEESLQCGQIT